MNRISLDQLTPIGKGLARPECVAATSSGSVFTSNWRGGVSEIKANGEVTEYLAPSSMALKPNGITLMKDGSFLLCHLGDNDGGVYRLRRDGSVEPLLLEVDGLALPPTNFAHEDKQGRLWITVSTHVRPRALAYRRDVADGFIVLLENGRARIVATDVGYTNECLVHPDGKRLFVNETFSRRLSTYDIAGDGSLSNKKTITEFSAATFPDGMAFDQEGAVWVTSIVSNRLIRVTEDGKQQLILEDASPENLEIVEAAFNDNALGRPHLDNIKSEKLRSVSSLAFSGPDLKTVVLGCLLGEELFTFRSPIAGVAPTHWNY